MKKNVSKKLFFLTGTVFLLLIFSIVLFLYFLGIGSFDGVFLKKEMSVSLVLDEKELLKESENWKVSAGEHSVTVKNKEKEAVRVLLLAKGYVLCEMTLSPGEESEARFSTPEGEISALLLGERKSIAYLFDAESFSIATDCMKGGGDLVFCRETVLPAKTLLAPFRFFGDFSFEEMSFDTHLEGNVVLFPSKSFSSRLYVSASSAKVYFRNFTPSFSRKATNYYIKAKSLNGNILDSSSFPVFSFEELKRLADESLLPRLTDGTAISIVQSFSITESLTFEKEVSLDFQKALDFGEHTLSFTASENATFSVRADIGCGPDAESLIFHAPSGSLKWISDGTVPSISTIEKHNNIAFYNGCETSLGGFGTALPEVKFLAEDNAFLEEDVLFSPQGNLLLGTLPFQVSRSDLDEAVYTLSCEDGSCTLEGSISSGRIVTTDENGNQHRFALAVNRDKKNIPVVYLETDGGALIESKTQYVSATFSLDGEGTQIPSQKETHIRIRGRGNSTWKWDKKPYKIHFDEPVSILGLPAAEEWALFANYADKSLMRNRLAQVMASELSFEYCPTQEYVDLFLNGEYLGIYGIGEHLEAGVGRIEVEHDMTQMDCGYLLEAGGVVSGVDVKGMNYFHAGLVKFVLIKQPEYNALTSEQFDFIKEYMQKANDAVKAGEGYEEYLDLDTLVDWLIMIELSNNTDCSWRRSTYFTKDPGQKLQMGPVWDFDLAFGNFSKDVAGFDVWVSTSEDDYVGETWSTYLLEDPKFQALFRARWLEVRDRLLSVAMEEIDWGYEILFPSAKENFERWDILGKKVAFERHDTKNYKTYASQIAYLKDFLIRRASWIDSQVSAW